MKRILKLFSWLLLLLVLAAVTLLKHAIRFCRAMMLMLVLGFEIYIVQAT